MPEKRALNVQNLVFITVVAVAMFRGCGTPPTVPQTAPVNDPPVAKVGPDVSVIDTDDNGSELVTLDGTGSSDPDPGDSVAGYMWKENGQVIGSGATPAIIFK